MDILAPVFAYLTCVAGIIGAFVISFSVVFSPPKQPAVAQQSAAVVSVTAAKPPVVADLKKSVIKGTTADNSAVNHVAPATQKREEPPQTATARTVQGPASPASASMAAPQKLAASDTHAKSKISRAQWREMVQQERHRRLAYQQNADFESRFLGYAD
jgi:hypothetical protein